MRCPRCQTEQSAAARFCEDCGAKLEMLCPSCGTSVTPGKRFCGACGAPLTPDGGGDTDGPSTEHLPKHLAERTVGAGRELEGERKHVTVLFADLRNSMELLATRDPEDARRLLDPVLEQMMEAVHHYEGTVNQVMGDGIMALFGAPIAHEDHALRACYAALRMQASVKRRASEGGRSSVVPMQLRVGLNSGAVVVRSIANDLSLDYSAIGQTTHLAGRMEQMATPGSILITADTWRLIEGLVTVRPLGPQAVRGFPEPVEIYELLGVARVQPRFRARMRGFTRFVGRDEEIEQLARARVEAAAGLGRVVAVVGDPGVGKSRLVYEFLETCRREGWGIAEARTVPYGRATPYLPIVALLESYFGLEEGEDADAVRAKVEGQLSRLDPSLRSAVPPLLALLGLSTAGPEWDALDPPQRRRAMLDAVKRTLVRESAVRPMVVVLEDMQWIDAQSEAVVDGLIDGLESARLLVLATYRPEYEDHWTRKPNHRRLRIDALPAEAAARLLDVLLGDDVSTAQLKPLLVERTEGNPFFLEETVQMLAETSVLRGKPGAYQMVREVNGVHVAPTVHAVLAARIDRLPPIEKRLLQSAAVIGRDVPFGILAQIADLKEDTLRVALASLQRADFLHEAHLFPDLEYTFRHALTHEVAYESLLVNRRREIHRRIVEAIEALHGARASEHAVILAHHAVRGELWEKAVILLRKAAAQAAERSAHQEVVSQLRQAIDALEHVPDSRERMRIAVDLRFALRNSLFALGHHEQTLQYLNEAAALAERLEDTHRLGWVSCYLMMQSLLVGDYARILAHGERALEASETLDDTALKSVANMGLGQAHHALGRYRDALAALSKSVAALRGPLLTQRFGMTSPPSVASLSWLAWCHAECGEFPDALARGHEALRIAEDINDPWSRAGARFGIGLAHLLQGNPAEAIQILDEALEISKAFALRTWFPPLASALGHGRCVAGDTQGGIPLLEAAVEQALAMRLRVRHSLRVCWLGEAYLADGRVPEARAMAAQALQLATDHHERGYVAWALRLLANVAAHTNGAREAEDHYGRAIALAEELGMRACLARCLLEMGTLKARMGHLDEARRHVLRSQQLFDAMHMTGWSTRAASVLTSPAE